MRQEQQSEPKLRLIEGGRSRFTAAPRARVAVARSRSSVARIAVFGTLLVLASWLASRQGTRWLHARLARSAPAPSAPAAHAVPDGDEAGS